MKQGESTAIYETGKVTFVLYPEVYTKFVSELMKNHDDIVRSMVLAQVKVEDGSAIDFLNTFLGTRVDRMAPMEVGYAEFLDALKMRIRSPASEAQSIEVAKQFHNHEMFPHRSDPTKPIFSDEPNQ